MLGPVEFFDVRLEVVLEARQHNHGVGNGVGECGNRVDYLEEPFDRCRLVGHVFQLVDEEHQRDALDGVGHLRELLQHLHRVGVVGARHRPADPLTVLTPHMPGIAAT